MKICWDGYLAYKDFLYVDNGCAMGFCRKMFWAVARQIATLCTKYGVQDKAVKRTFPSHFLAA